VAASGPPSEALLNSGLDFLKRKGFMTITGRHLGKKTGYLAGTDAERVEDINEMLRNPLVRAVMLARGGYGAMRILNSIDCEALLQDPKILLGMSDVTALQMSLYSRCGLVTLAGPFLAGQIGEGLDPLSEESLMRALTEPIEGRDLFDGVANDLRLLKCGKASGPLLGGCLSLICALMGTPHLPDLTGTILFLEDIQEPPYRIDRMLTQMKLAGVLDSVNAVVLGHFVGPDHDNLLPEVERILLEMTSDKRFPVVSGFPHGHKLPNITIPSGVPAELDTSVPSLTVRVG